MIGKAVANMEQRHWVEAVEDLQKAYRQDPRDIDTIMNLIICYKWLKDEEECQKYQTSVEALIVLL